MKGFFNKQDASVWIGMLSSGLLGLCLLFSVFGDSLQRWSYDLLFLARPTRQPREAVIVYMDESAHKALDQPMNAPWSRALHAQLLQRLKAAGARAVVLDVVFSDPGINQEDDAKLAAAIKANGKVFLGGDLVESVHPSGMPIRTFVEPIKTFSEVSAGWGLVFFPVDSDMAVRRQLTGLTEAPTLAQKVVGVLGSVSPRVQEPPFWMNYYGPPGTIPSISYHQALLADGVPPEFFKDKVVFVGQHLATDMASKLKDDLGTPYTWISGRFSPGVEIQATAFLNLLRNEPLKRVSLAWEIILVLLVAFLGGISLKGARPLRCVTIAVAAAVLTAFLAWCAFRFGLIWFAWLIPVAQLGMSLIVSVFVISLQMYVDKRRLEDSLALHLSPGRVRQLINDPALLKPGGHEAEVTILFSDIANFSKISETMIPKDIFDQLNKYYETALNCVFQEEGMVVSLIGDAILAIWNAPEKQENHQARACRAAIELHRKLVSFDLEQASRPMRTRVGVHTGTAIVGNLGSKKRFEFTAIGDSTNLASRLEGLNKHLGTYVLASRQSQRAVEGEITSRCVGDFVFKGFGRAVEVHELIGPADMEETTRPWREMFSTALRHFQRQNFDAARDCFLKTIELRRRIGDKGSGTSFMVADDGPSAYYLKQIEELRGRQLPHDWNGQIELKEK